VDACSAVPDLPVPQQILQFDTADPLFQFGDDIVSS
jgi:hypothetical protein